MTIDRSSEYLQGLLRELCALPKETEWVEFKVGDSNPVKIGEYISALANSAALCGKAHGYLIWGIKDITHEIVGTEFLPSQTKKGNEELENWLLQALNPKIHFKSYEFRVENKMVVILEIARAAHRPVQFKELEFIRVGSYKKKLKGYPEKERELWRIFDQTPFEEQIAADHVSAEDVFRLLNYSAYFELLELDLPENREAILDRLKNDEMIIPCSAGGWNITNMGAILFAKSLNSFKHLRRKAVRVIVYKGNSRIETTREQVGGKGYAFGFEGLIEFINNLLPVNEVFGQALRKEVPMYPEVAVRELVANAIIHQDFTMPGTGPMIEIFAERMEITNPGKPLVKTERFLDSPPKSRNETLASFMRRVGICEERGSGVDKVVFQTEYYQLPAPLFEATGDHTRCILFAHKPLNKMDKDDKIRACYLHTCLRHVKREFTTNSSIRERFGMKQKSQAIASRIIHATVEKGWIKLHDPESESKKHAKYVPFWV
ncbi:MAG: putative DNA binding domain-containing protein [Phycisphaerae bacterium]|nr:putative DNA binding domain-containing protein [Phycisphaerae bacterium]